MGDGVDSSCEADRMIPSRKDMRSDEQLGAFRSTVRKRGRWWRLRSREVEFSRGGGERA